MDGEAEADAGIAEAAGLDGGGGLLEEVEVVGVELDLDGLGGALEVADQVAEHAVEVHVDLGLDLLEPIAELGHYLFGAVFGIGADLDQKVAGVGLGQFEAERDAGAAGKALDVGGVLEGLFDLAERAVAFGEAGAGRVDDVVEDEAALFEGGEELGLEAAVEVDAGDDEQGAQAERDEAVAKRGADGGLVDAGDGAEDEAAFTGVVGVLRFDADDPSGQ